MNFPDREAAFIEKMEFVLDPSRRFCLKSWIANLLAGIGIDPIPSFAIRSKVAVLPLGAIGADQNSAPAAIVLTARRICGFEVRVRVVVHNAFPDCLAAELFRGDRSTKR